MTPRLTIEDRSSRVRLGCKGPGAEAWLASAGVAPAIGANRWHTVAGVQVLRLGLGEFLLAAADPSGKVTIERLAAAIATQCPDGVYPVPREDVVMTLGGPALPALLRQVCNVDFAPAWRERDLTQGAVILTSMAGVTVTALAEPSPGPTLTLWIDPSFADYFRHMLDEVAAGELTWNNANLPEELP